MSGDDSCWLEYTQVWKDSKPGGSDSSLDNQFHVSASLLLTFREVRDDGEEEADGAREIEKRRKEKNLRGMEKKISPTHLLSFLGVHPVVHDSYVTQ